MPVIVEASLHDVNIQLHVQSDVISTSGSVGAIKAVVLSLGKLSFML